MSSLVRMLITVLSLVFFCTKLSFASDGSRLPDDVRQLAQKAADAFKMEDYDSAVKDYQSIIKAHPDSLYGWSNLGVTRFQQGHLDEALNAFTQAVRLNPKDAFIQINLGMTYLELKRFPEAILVLQAAIEINPNDATAHENLAEAYEKMGRKVDAEKEFDKAKALNHPTNL